MPAFFNPRSPRSHKAMNLATVFVAWLAIAFVMFLTIGTAALQLAGVK